MRSIFTPIDEKSTLQTKCSVLLKSLNTEADDFDVELATK